MGKLVDIKEAVEGLREGKTILYPTDTIWGIGCAISHEDAILKIKEIKHRNPKKSFILLVESVAMLERYVKKVPDICYDLIDLATRPTTIIYDSPIGLPQEVCAEDGSVGIRVTSDPTCRKIIQQLRIPIVSTSANLSGEDFAQNFSEIKEEIKEKVDLILNQRLEERMISPSSIIKIGNDGRIQIIR